MITRVFRNHIQGRREKKVVECANSPVEVSAEIGRPAVVAVARG